MELLCCYLYLATDERELVVTRQPRPERLVALTGLAEGPTPTTVTNEEERSQAPRLIAGSCGQADEPVDKCLRLQEQPTSSDEEVLVRPPYHGRLAHHAQALHEPAKALGVHSAACAGVAATDRANAPVWPQGLLKV